MKIKFDRLYHSLQSLSFLCWLMLEGNNITILPDSVGKLKELVRLDLRKNKISILPNSIGNLKELTELNLSYNYLFKRSLALTFLFFLLIISTRDYIILL